MNKKTLTIFAIVAAVILLSVAVFFFQSGSKKIEIGFGGAYDTCSNLSLQKEFDNMGYAVTCYGKNAGSSDLLKLPGDPTIGENIDLIITSSNATQKLRDAYGSSGRFIGESTAMFNSPMLPLIQTKDIHVLLDPGIIEKRGNYLFWTSESLANAYELQASGEHTWGDLGVTDPTWKIANILISGTNPFVSGTGYNGYSYGAACLGTKNLGETPCSKSLDYNMLDAKLKEQMRGVFASYGSQSEDGNVINYMKQWMFGSNRVLVIIGNESFPMLFASSQGNPAFVEDMTPIYTTYGYMSSQFANSVSQPGEQFIKDMLGNPKVAEIVNRELGSRMGYANSTLSSTAASWVPASDPMAYIQLPTSDVKAPLLCYVGFAERINAKLMWTTTFGQKTSEDGKRAADGSSFEDAIKAYCAKNQ
jgi:hypothetical protein